MSLAISEIASKMPTKNPIGPCLKLMNLPTCPNTPSARNAQKWIITIATIAIASVVFRSVFALLNHGTSIPACLPGCLFSFHSLTVTSLPIEPGAR